MLFNYCAIWIDKAFKVDMFTNAFKVTLLVILKLGTAQYQFIWLICHILYNWYLRNRAPNIVGLMFWNEYHKIIVYV